MWSFYSAWTNALALFVFPVTKGLTRCHAVVVAMLRMVACPAVEDTKIRIASVRWKNCRYGYIQIKLKKLNKLPSWVASPVRSLVDGRTLPLVLPLLRRLLNKPPSPVGSQVRASWSLKLEENVCTSVLKVQSRDFRFRKQKGFWTLFQILKTII